LEYGTAFRSGRFLPRCMECRRGLAMRILSVCPSVCLSNACIVTKRKKNLSRFLIPCERSFSLVLWEEEWLVGATASIWNFGSTGPRWSEIADYEPIIARSASTVRPSETSSINTNRKSLTRFPTSLRWSPYVAHKSPKGGLKTQSDRFSSIIELRLKKVCYKVSFCANCQRKSCRAFIGLTIHAKIIVGDVPFCLKFWVKSPIFDLFAFVATQPYDLAKKFN